MGSGGNSASLGGTENERRILFMSGLAKGIAEGLGIRVIVGSDWNSDGVLKDQKFHDLFHLELHPSEA